MREPVFYYDFASPYAYLAAHRVEEVMPGRVRWQPILFGALLQAVGKEPWSWQEGPAREQRMAACVAHAAELGLPLSWPRDWPRGTYSVLALRAALVAEEHGRLREFTLAAFHQGLGLGRDLTDLGVVLEAAEAAGVSAAAVRDGVVRPEVKARLRAVTDEAVARGVTGIPTIALGEQLFWGEDRLDEAAAAMAGGPAA